MTIARLALTVIDCPDPWALAPFYEELTGLRHAQEGPNWILLGEDEERHGIALQRVDGFRAPRWPDPAYPQQMHLDLVVDDLDSATAQVLALGATALPGSSAVHRVFADPVGHPFCLSIIPAADEPVAG